jgi:hypothetical protein
MLHFFIDVLKEWTFWTEEVYSTFDIRKFIEVWDFINEDEILSITLH